MSLAGFVTRARLLPYRKTAFVAVRSQVSFGLPRGRDFAFSWRAPAFCRGFGSRGKNPYEILSVSRGASAREIRLAYLKAAKRHHPDLNKGDPDAKRRFQQVADAYEKLSETVQGENFDASGSSAGPAAGGHSAGPKHEHTRQRDQYQQDHRNAGHAGTRGTRRTRGPENTTHGMPYDDGPDPYDLYRRMYREFGFELAEQYLNDVQRDAGRVAADVAKGDYSSLADFAVKHRTLLICIAVPTFMVIRFPGVLSGAVLAIARGIATYGLLVLQSPNPICMALRGGLSLLFYSIASRFSFWYRLLGDVRSPLSFLFSSWNRIFGTVGSALLKFRLTLWVVAVTVVVGIVTVMVMMMDEMERNPWKEWKTEREKEKEFDEMCEWVRKTPMPVTQDEKIKRYAFFKQATSGDVKGYQRVFGPYDQAWAGLKGMGPEEARQKYIEEVKSQREKYGF